MRLKDQEITVLGAGIGGLAVAYALARAGARVWVLEQAETLRSSGAGLQLSPNGMAVLHALGLGDALRPITVAAQAVQLRDAASGRSVARLDLGRLRPDQHYRFVSRGALIAELAKAAEGAGVEIVTGSRVASVGLDMGGAELRMSGGQAARVPLLIGADGLHSVLRPALNGPEVPFFTHQVAWRAVIKGQEDDLPEVQVFMAPGRHLVSYPLCGGLRNIVAVEERHTWAEEGWSIADDPAHLRAAFAGFGGPVPGWLARVQETHLWGLFRHDVARCWHRQGAVLLGDSAHPTLPFLAQGANMALEDAFVLARALAEGPDIDAALADYAAQRHPRTCKIVAAANSNARAYHLGGVSRLVAHVGLRVVGRVAPGLMLRRFDWLYGHDVTR